jgi:hypothetical protein
MASASSGSTDPERHRVIDAQRRARLDELAEARRQLDEELANLHRELGEDHEPRNWQPAPLPAPRQVLVQEQHREGNGERQERRPAVEQTQARALTLSARGCTRDNDRCANEGLNVDANTGSDAPPLFRRASQNLAAVAMLLRDFPKAATSKERQLRQQLKALLKAAATQQAESSASCQQSECNRGVAPSAHRPNPPPSRNQDRGGGAGAAASAIKSHLGPTASPVIPSRLADGLKRRQPPRW